MPPLAILCLLLDELLLRVEPMPSKLSPAHNREGGKEEHDTTTLLAAHTSTHTARVKGMEEE